MNKQMMVLGFLMLMGVSYLSFHQPSPRQIAVQVKQQTVRIVAPLTVQATLFDIPFPSQKAVSFCSGVLYKKNGLVLTASHCLNKETVEPIVLLGLPFGSVKYTRTALLAQSTDGVVVGCQELKIDTTRDVGIIHCPGFVGRSGVADLEFFTIPLGERVVTSGFPGGGEHVLTDGIVSNILTEKGKVLISALIGPGMSGGGVFDYNGRLVGLIQAVYVNPPFTGIITSPLQLRKFVYDWEKSHDRRIEYLAR